jgi:outer membrane murein-binding lipoprotein Lpp
MKHKRFILIAVLLVFTVLLSGCAKNTEDDLKNKDAVIEQLQSEKQALEEEVADLKQQISQQQSGSILDTALDVIGLIKDQDMTALATHVHPDKGVRFSPYAYVNVQNDLVFTAQQVTTLLQNNQVYNWGEYDGSGDPIQLNFSDYYDRFIYDQDFANPHMIGNHVVIGTGNTINNIDQVYSAGTFIEFHFSGFDPQYAGMDWRSLNLVFEEVSGTWYLVGIVHNEWTI